MKERSTNQLKSISLDSRAMFSVRIMSNSCSICSNRWCNRPFVLCNASDFDAPFRPRVPTAPRVSTRGRDKRPAGGLDPLLTELVRDLSGAAGGRDMMTIVGQVVEQRRVRWAGTFPCLRTTPSLPTSSLLLVHLSSSRPESGIRRGQQPVQRTGKCDLQPNSIRH